MFGESCKPFFILLPKRIELPNLPFNVTLPSSGIICLRLKLDKNLSPKVLTWAALLFSAIPVLSVSIVLELSLWVALLLNLVENPW